MPGLDGMETLSRLVARLAQRVVGVERPTIYSWTKDKILLRERHRSRLAALTRLMRVWTRISSRPLGTLKNATIGERTLMDLLSDSSVSENTISEALRDVAARALMNKKDIGETSIGAIARQRGWAKVSAERSEQTLRSLQRRQGA